MSPLRGLLGGLAPCLMAHATSRLISPLRGLLGGLALCLMAHAMSRLISPLRGLLGGAGAMSHGSRHESLDIAPPAGGAWMFCVPCGKGLTPSCHIMSTLRVLTLNSSVSHETGRKPQEEAPKG